MVHTNIAKTQSQNCAGIDVGKTWLDVALADGRVLERRSNQPEDHVGLVADLRQHAITRVGLEATGGYEQAIVMALREAGFEVHLFQPHEVKAYAAYTRQRAKSDKLDAVLIARCTADLKTVREAPDPRLLGFSQHLTLVDQMVEDIARIKTRCEHVTDPDIREHYQSEIKRLKVLKQEKLKKLQASVRLHADLSAKLDLIVSIDGIGMRTALVLLIRMPELGTISRQQAASLLGVAPVLRESGAFKGQRHIAGGRSRARTSTYACAQVAIKWNATLKVFYDRLKANSKHHSTIITACARKLIIFVNTVLTRKTTWQKA